MIEIREVKTRREKRDFLNFPLKLYKGCPFFVPPLYADEKALFKKNYFHYKTSACVFYNAYENGAMVGRVQGILQREANKKWNQKRIRFTRFDAIDKQAVADALFQALENWAKAQGMEEMVGPLGFSDMDREGLLIDGFREIATFEEQYNFPYYQTLIENLGYHKEVDWTERKLYAPAFLDERIRRVSEESLAKFHLHFANPKNTRQLIKQYGEAFFDIVDTTYAKIYQTVPLSPEERASMIKSFKLVLSPRYLNIIVDEKGRCVCFGLGFPSLSKAVQKSNGHLTLGCLLRLVKAIKRPEIIDMGLVGVVPEYLNSGIEWAIIYKVMRMLSTKEIRYCETNLNLEDNLAIQNTWKRFESVAHKRRRSYVKSLR
jgi:hypothetical protein